jgi:hypothetical protein
MDLISWDFVSRRPLLQFTFQGAAHRKALSNRRLGFLPGLDGAENPLPQIL